MSEKNERKKYMLLPTYAKNAANKRKPYSLTQIFTGSQYAKIRKKGNFIGGHNEYFPQIMAPNYQLLEKIFLVKIPVFGPLLVLLSMHEQEEIVSF